MNQLVPLRSAKLPELVKTAGEPAGMRFLEFFAANIRNPHTRTMPMPMLRMNFWPGAPMPACRRSLQSSRCTWLH
jgi:hypothetical protein